MNYKENPKLVGSGIVACIPQTGRCPNGCADCFFQSGRSYLEPLDENLPNMPSAKQVGYRVVMVNDGNGSSVDMWHVMQVTKQYQHKFYNTTSAEELDTFDAPVVLTVNPGELTDCAACTGAASENLMFVRFRTNTWNLSLCDSVIDCYTKRAVPVPVVLTFMAYFDTADKIPESHRQNYVWRKRTTNGYYAITTDAWRTVMVRYQDNILVSSCGKIEGEKGSTKCRFCGVCLREYFATVERMIANKEELEP